MHNLVSESWAVNKSKRIIALSFTTISTKVQKSKNLLPISFCFEAPLVSLGEESTLPRLCMHPDGGEGGCPRGQQPPKTTEVRQEGTGWQLQPGQVFKPEKLKWMLRFSEGHWFLWASLGLVRQKQLLTFHTQPQEEQNQSSLQVEHGKGMLA